MVPTKERRVRGRSLPLRLSLALLAGALFVALVLGFLGADRDGDHQAGHKAGRELALAQSLAERAAPLLDRSDLMRLSVLTAVGRDQAPGRVILLDRAGRVVIDTSLALGDRTLGLIATSGHFQRRSDLDGTTIRETLVPVRFAGDVIGELRLQCAIEPYTTVFDVSWFGLVLLCCLSLVAVAAIMGYHWSARVRSATDALIRLSAGELQGGDAAPAEGELQDLQLAMREMERGVQDGLQLVNEGYVGMALQIVVGLEGRKLAVPGHGERCARLATRLAERLQILPADRADLDLACRLVDLGKAWVRPSILSKQGPLTAAEQVSLARHPVHAAQQLECMPGLRRTALILRHQLERYDGAGSPDGLRGDRIPLGSRVLAIVAAFDLLTTCAAERPLDWSEALLRIEGARGEVFDPWLVDLFAAELRREPPVDGDAPPVMIVPNGMPWQEATPGDGAGDDEDDEPDLVGELEVMHDERSEDAP